MIFHRDQLSTVIGNIRIPIGLGEEVGTAIFIAKSDNIYLLTAAHVVKKINAASNMVISKKDGSPQTVLLTDLLGAAIFEEHPDVDLAKVKIEITEANKEFIEGRCYPYDQIDMSDNLVSKDTELTVIGFPMGMGATGSKFTPLSFRTFVSAPAITLPRFDTLKPCDFILLESPSMGGYSGGPLFDLGYVISGGLTTTKENTILHGIVHGTISDQTGGKVAAITPSKYLKGWL